MRLTSSAWSTTSSTTLSSGRFVFTGRRYLITRHAALKASGESLGRFDYLLINGETTEQVFAHPGELPWLEDATRRLLLSPRLKPMAALAPHFPSLRGGPIYLFEVVKPDRASFFERSFPAHAFSRTPAIPAERHNLILNCQTSLATTQSFTVPHHRGEIRLELLARASPLSDPAGPPPRLLLSLGPIGTEAIGLDGGTEWYEYAVTWEGVETTGLFLLSLQFQGEEGQPVQIRGVNVIAPARKGELMPCTVEERLRGMLRGNS